MPFAINPIDKCRIYFIDEGGSQPPVVFLAGLGGTAEAFRDWGIAKGLEGFCRRIFIEHRGHGQSDKPHDAAAYGIQLRVADVVAVLDATHVEKAHIIGASWGARLGFGVGEHAAERVLSLALGGNAPFGIGGDGPIRTGVTAAFASGKGIQGFIAALERIAPIPEAVRSSLLQNDEQALAAAWAAAMAEGPVATNLLSWDLPCLIYAGTQDEDFFEGAKRAADQIPGARFVAIEGKNHISAHANVDDVLPHIKAMIDG
jgi:pimeloyl-ACP methyl ester carboxylesterase